MLDALADFWKPMKKQAQEKLRPEQLQLGSAIGFGFVPQASISGRRLQVTAVNTYQFGDDPLTSFVLTQEKDPGVSMIIAESEGEHYLAISRHISVSERMKMFDSRDLENVMQKSEITHLPCKSGSSEFKGWLVPSYKREIQGLKGRIFKGDFRKNPVPSPAEGQEFEYTLLVSDNNEHAVEIEKYADGRLELYATVYRRMSDIGEISHPPRTDQLSRPDLKLASKPEEKETAVKEEAKAATPFAPVLVAKSEPVISKPADAPAAVPVKETAKEAKEKEPVQASVKSEPIHLKELAPSATPAPEAKAEAKPAPTPAKAEEKPASPAAPFKETKTPEQARPASLPLATDAKPKVSVFVKPSVPHTIHNQEIKAVSNITSMNGFDNNEAIECDLKVANKIIDEAIRNEMRLSDVVRRIIELPVAYPESVQIPMTLSDEDYALLAIRYGISSTDRNAIKSRIIEDLNNFSGNGAVKKAA